jgi:Cdc6-like AAA superfamily ATPase
MDVEAIHAEARELFNTTLQRVTRPRMSSTGETRVGRMILVRGEAGSGKTHLMRAFRNHVHRNGSGYFGYMQMTTASGDYQRYVLRKLIDSLDTPYYHTPAHPDSTTGLMRLSTGVAESPHVGRENMRRLREGGLELDEAAALVLQMADDAVFDPRLSDIPIDLLIAMLFLQSEHPALRNRVMKYLRGESLGEYDRSCLAGVMPLDQEGLAQVMIENLAKLMWSLHDAALILCVDQIEDVACQGDLADFFTRATTGLSAITANVPTSIALIACLDDYYISVSPFISQSTRDRLENDPGPITISGARTCGEISAVVERHLSCLYDYFDLELDERRPTYPIPEELLRRHENGTIRRALVACKRYRERCIEQEGLTAVVADRLSNSLAQEPKDARASRPRDEAYVALDQAWNDCVVYYEKAVPEDDEQMATLLATAMAFCFEELDAALHVDVDRNGHLVCLRIENRRTQEGLSRRVIGICNKTPGGGHLGKQVERLLKFATNQGAEAIPIVVRSTEYRPVNPTAAIAATLANVARRGGRQVVASISTWRAFAAMQDFRQSHLQNRYFGDWLRHCMPLTRLEAVRSMLDLDSLLTARLLPTMTDEELGLTKEEVDGMSASTVAAPANSVSESEAVIASKKEQATSGFEAVTEFPPEHGQAEGVPETSSEIFVGHRRSMAKDPITLSRDGFTCHAAFLGAPGSGKTTAALNVIEQLLEQRVPCLLVDRKGDLATYARASAWDIPQSDSTYARRQRTLREQLDVKLFTPGNLGGYPIRLAVVPEGLAQMNEAERQLTTACAARSLGAMLGFKEFGKGAKLIGVLTLAIDLLGRMGCREVTLDALIAYIGECDDALVSAIGKLDVKLLNTLVQDLQALAILQKHLFGVEGEPLSAERLFGMGQFAQPGKTRLSIISTKFLGGKSTIQFWVSQLLFELIRWSSKSPSDQLQAVVMFDEADLYLPAMSKPVCKEPMDGLLKRARSAGLSVMLATQSPGDFDYKCKENVSTWFVGRIKEVPAIKKMKPMLSDVKQDIGAQLANQETGEFYLVKNGSARPIRSNPSLIETSQVPEMEILKIASSSMRCGE